MDGRKVKRCNTYFGETEVKFVFDKIHFDQLTLSTNHSSFRKFLFFKKTIQQKKSEKFKYFI